MKKTSAAIVGIGMLIIFAALMFGVAKLFTPETQTHPMSRPVTLGVKG